MKTLVIASLAFLAVSTSLGIWIGIGGHPYGTALLTVHKLASIAFLVLCVIFTINTTHGASFTTGNVILFAVFIVSAAALLATGGVMSAKAPSQLLRIVHIAATAAMSFTALVKLISYLLV